MLVKLCTNPRFFNFDASSLRRCEIQVKDDELGGGLVGSTGRPLTMFWTASPAAGSTFRRTTKAASASSNRSSASIPKNSQVREFPGDHGKAPPNAVKAGILTEMDGAR